MNLLPFILFILGWRPARSFSTWQPRGSNTLSTTWQGPQELLKFVDEYALSEYACSSESILNRVAAHHRADCQSATVLAVEQQDPAPTAVPSFEWIEVPDQDTNYRLALTTTEPLLNTTSLQIIRQSAEHLWQTSVQTSRFTYQRQGNYEAHVSDLSLEAKQIVNDCLEDQIYPLLRNTYCTDTPGRLCVYDALVIRYNATEASSGAGQPLHRDLGMVSVNIMLNDPSEFVGGGTFFENQLRAWPQAPLKPAGPGRGLVHPSAERHAGSATTAGVRDILVLFITLDSGETPPALVQSAWLKSCRNVCDEQHRDAPVKTVQCRVRHQRLAIEAVPTDGEAWQYLGLALVEMAGLVGREELLRAAQDCLTQSLLHNPCDSRAYNNLALTLGRLESPPTVVEETFRKGLDLLNRSQQAGCDVEDERDALVLNYGLHVSNQDRFAEACQILWPVASRKEIYEQQGRPVSRVVNDVYRLWAFCSQQLPQ